MEEQRHEEEDHFKRMPDDLLRHILSILRSVHVKSMGRCPAVSKRFRSIVPLMTSFTISISIRSHIVRPSDHLRRSMLTSQSRQSCSCYLDRYMNSHWLERTCICDAKAVVRRLKPFPEIRTLNIDAGATDFDCCHAGGHGSVVLKLKAELGCCDQIKSCAILAATSLQRTRPGNHEHSSLEGLVGELYGSEDHPQPPHVTLPSPSSGDDYEVMRIISCVMSWMESILLVHSAVRQIVPGHPMLREVVVKDSGGKMVLHVGAAELSEMRSCKRGSITWEGGLARQCILPLRDIESEMWFVRELVLPESGYVMRGATLWVSSTRANDAGTEGNISYGDIVGFHFDEDIDRDLRGDGETTTTTTTSPVLEAVCEMRKKMDTKPCTVKMVGTEIIKLDRHLPCQGIELMSVSSSIA